MNDRTRKTIAKIFAVVGSSASAICAILFSGVKNILGLVLLATLAGTVGNLLFAFLGNRLMRLEKKLTRSHSGDIVVAFNCLPVENTAIAAQAGGQGRVLARLYQAGYPIPDGFILLPGAFVQDDLRDGVWEQVEKQLTRLRAGKQITFAVRSSALQEDSAQASFAGEFESVLDVCSDEEIHAALQTVQQSRYSARVQSYSQAQGIAGTEHPIGVII